MVETLEVLSNIVTVTEFLGLSGLYRFVHRCCCCRKRSAESAPDNSNEELKNSKTNSENLRTPTSGAVLCQKTKTAGRRALKVEAPSEEETEGGNSTTEEVATKPTESGAASASRLSSSQSPPSHARHIA